MNQQQILNDDEEQLLDEVKGRKRRKLVLLSKEKLSKNEMDELFLGGK